MNSAWYFRLLSNEARIPEILYDRSKFRALFHRTLSRCALSFSSAENSGRGRGTHPGDGGGGGFAGSGSGLGPGGGALDPGRIPARFRRMYSRMYSRCQSALAFPFNVIPDSP
jgi:hypothetical protein